MSSVFPVGSEQSYWDYADVSGVKEELGKDDFYKLISAQLKYQNPLEPVDDVDFMSQTAQFNMLEQLMNLNSSIQSLMQSQNTLYANSLIGKEINWLDENLEIRQGIVERVLFSEDGLQLVVDGMEVDIYSIVSVSEVSQTEDPQDGLTE
jgi:flagellar basal-body rod modification protein FlgD